MRCILGATLALGILIGVLVGRWWAIVLALPAALLASSMFSFEGFSDGEIAVLHGIAVALGLTLGVITRKGIERVTRNDPPTPPD
jgi:hypothetical protein